MANILIAGCGYIGKALAEELLRDGHNVWAIKRNTDDLSPIFNPIRADLTSLQHVDLPKKLDYIFYLAAPKQHDDASYRKTYVKGLTNLLAQLKQTEQKSIHVFFISSTSVYSQKHGEWVDETSVTQSTSFSGQRLLEAEQVLFNSGFEASVIRFAGIYGPGRNSLLNKIAQGEAIVNAKSIYTNRIHRDDCVAILKHLLQIKKRQKIYLGVDCEPAPKSHVCQWLAQQLNIPLSEAQQATTNIESGYRSNKRCSNERILASGYAFKFPTFREGYRKLIMEKLLNSD